MLQKIKTYSSGLRLVVQTSAESKALSLHVNIATGSCNETNEISGISHLIEHMLFKGTKTRSAEQLSEEFEASGVQVNAYTNKHNTCIYAKCIEENIEKSFELISDILFNSTFNEKNIKRERKVIFEEIDMYEDDPATIAHEGFSRLFFKGTNLESPIIGTKKSLKNIRREDIVDYTSKYYISSNIVISIAGGISFEKAEKLTSKYFADEYKNITAEPKLAVINDIPKLFPQRNFISKTKDISQSHISFGFPIDNVYHENRSVINVINFMLGGGISSRLFQRIREKLGLVYSICSFPEFYDIGGSLIISLATNNINQQKALSVIKEELDLLKNKGITEDELKRAKTFYKSSIIMSGESSHNISRQNLNNLLIFNRIRDIDERIAEINNVTLFKVNSTLKNLFDNKNICGYIVSDKPDKKIFDLL